MNQPITEHPDDLLKSSVEGLYATLDILVKKLGEMAADSNNLNQIKSVSESLEKCSSMIARLQPLYRQAHGIEDTPQHLQVNFIAMALKQAEELRDISCRKSTPLLPQ